MTHTLVELPAEAPVSLPEGVLFEFQTLPVRITSVPIRMEIKLVLGIDNVADQACVMENKVDPKAVADGDTITVYVSTSEPVVSSLVPREVNLAAVQRAKAREKRNYPKADELHQKIIDSGYRVLNIENEEVLARKFRIRLR